MKDKRLTSEASQFPRFVPAAPRERLLVHSGCGLVARSVRRAALWIRWYVVACVTAAAASLWLFIL